MTPGWGGDLQGQVRRGGIEPPQYGAYGPVALPTELPPQDPFYRLRSKEPPDGTARLVKAYRHRLDHGADVVGGTLSSPAAGESRTASTWGVRSTTFSLSRISL